MTAQDKELAQLYDSIVDDVKGLVDKYMSIVGWDVPENDEETAKMYHDHANAGIAAWFMQLRQYVKNTKNKRN